MNGREEQSLSGLISEEEMMSIFRGMASANIHGVKTSTIKMTSNSVYAFDSPDLGVQALLLLTTLISLATFVHLLIRNNRRNNENRSHKTALIKANTPTKLIDQNAARQAQRRHEQFRDIFSREQKKKWYAKPEALEMSEEYLLALSELMRGFEEEVQALTQQDDTVHVYASEAKQSIPTMEAAQNRISEGKQEVTENLAPASQVKQISSKRRAVAHSQTAHAAQTAAIVFDVKDKIIQWDQRLPSYNLSKQMPVDPNRPVYIDRRTGQHFIFVNQFLSTYLMVYDTDAAKLLTSLCINAKSQLGDGSKGQNGLIIRAEENATKLEKSVRPMNAKKGRNSAPSKLVTTEENVKYFLKIKHAGSATRFFGESVAKVGKFTLFEINGYKANKQKSNKITYFPSETQVSVAKITAK